MLKAELGAKAAARALHPKRATARNTGTGQLRRAEGGAIHSVVLNLTKAPTEIENCTDLNEK